MNLAFFYFIKITVGKLIIFFIHMIYLKNSIMIQYIRYNILQDMNKDINNSLLKICLICQHNISLKNRNYVNLSCECKNYYHSECLKKW